MKVCVPGGDSTGGTTADVCVSVAPRLELSPAFDEKEPSMCGAHGSFCATPIPTCKNKPRP